MNRNIDKNMSMTLQRNQNTIYLNTSASLSVEYIYYAISTILFIRGFSTLSNYTVQYHHGIPIWILNNEKLSCFFKPQLKSLRVMLLNHFVRKIFLYLKSSTTNEILERWDFVVECKEHNGGVLNYDLSVIQREIDDVLQQVCSIANYLPILTQEWKYSITIKLEEPLKSNVNAFKTSGRVKK